MTDYLQTPEWQADRKACFSLHGYKCLVRGCKNKDITCDHIYARKLFRWLQKVRKFHQPLCDYHNKKKGQKIIDYRPLRYRLFRPLWFVYYWLIKWIKRAFVMCCVTSLLFVISSSPSVLIALQSLAQWISQGARYFYE